MIQEKISQYCEFCGTLAKLDERNCVACGNVLNPPLNGNLSENDKTLNYVSAEFKVQQKLFAWDNFKLINNQGKEFAIVARKGSSVFRPLLTIDSIAGERLGTIQGNFWKTKFDIRDKNGNIQATIRIPFFMPITKKFEIETSEGIFKSGNSLYAHKFEAYSPSGNIAFIVDKEILTIRDQYLIKSFGELNPLIVTLAAICIDIRLFGKSETNDPKKIMNGKLPSFG